MNRKSDSSLLRNFFSGYFHEDWHCDAKTPEEVVVKYRNSGVSDEHLRSLSDAVMKYSQEVTNDIELEDSLFSDLGCYHRPSLENQSARSWLRDVASWLINDRSNDVRQ